MVKTQKKGKRVVRYEWAAGRAPCHLLDSRMAASILDLEETRFHDMEEVNLALDWNGHVELPSPMRPA